MNQVFMMRALELARKGIGLTSPNPCVGAVIVKGGIIIAEGWHRKAGGDHAEIVAIKKVMKKSGIKTVDLEPMLFHNATLYVTLEPCVHKGKTAPCARAIVAAGFKKVCVGMKDPFEKVNGSGIKYLRDHGVDVKVCIAGTRMVDEIKAINQPFIKWAQLGLPYVTMKAGITLDGKIATSTGESKWITSEEARKDARIERGKYDAVLVGSGTVRADDPELAAYGKYKNKKLLRVIIDRKLCLDLKFKIFRDENVFVACTDLATDENKIRFEKGGVEFKSFGEKNVSVKRLLEFLGKRDIQSVFVEGGSTIHGAFYDESLNNGSLLDSALYYIAPKLIGGRKSLSAIGGDGVEKLSNALNLGQFEIEKVGTDIRVEGAINLY